MHYEKEIFSRTTPLRSRFPSLSLVKRKTFKCPSPTMQSPLTFHEYSITEWLRSSFLMRRRSNCLIALFLPNRCGCCVGVFVFAHGIADGELILVLKKKEGCVWTHLEKENTAKGRMDSIQVDRPFVVVFHPATKKVCILLQCTGDAVQNPQIATLSSQTADPLHPTTSLLLQWNETNHEHALEQRITVCADVASTSASCSVIVLPLCFHHL